MAVDSAYFVYRMFGFILLFTFLHLTKMSRRVKSTAFLYAQMKRRDHYVSGNHQKFRITCTLQRDRKRVLG